MTIALGESKLLACQDFLATIARIKIIWKHFRHPQEVAKGAVGALNSILLLLMMFYNYPLVFKKISRRFIRITHSFSFSRGYRCYFLQQWRP